MQHIIKPLVDMFDDFGTSPIKSKKKRYVLPRKRTGKPSENDTEGLHLSSQCYDKKGKLARQDRFIDAYVNCRFNVTKAARETGVSRRIFYIWRTEPDFMERFENAVETKKDWVEDKLFQKVAEGDVAACIFCAKCLLSDRGYLPDKLMKLDIRHSNNTLNLTKEERDNVVAAASITPESIGLDFSKY